MGAGVSPRRIRLPDVEGEGYCPSVWSWKVRFTARSVARDAFLEQTEILISFFFQGLTLSPRFLSL